MAGRYVVSDDVGREIALANGEEFINEVHAMEEVCRQHPHGLLWLKWIRCHFVQQAAEPVIMWTLVIRG